MGYYTRYHLELRFPDGAKELVPQCEHEIPAGGNFCPECGKQVKNVYVEDLIWEVIREDEHDTYYGLTMDGDVCKWYDHSKLMLELRKRFPFTLFVLSGEGEVSGDIWKKYYLDGKCQIEKAQIVIGEFDPDKLA